MGESTPSGPRDFYPPYGHTGVEPVSVGMGWLSGSSRPEDPKVASWELVNLLRSLTGRASQLTQGNRHYGSGVRADDWSWQVVWDGRGGAAGSVWAEVRQSVWEGLGADWGALASALIPTLNASRLDIAADFARPCLLPAHYFALRTGARTRTHRGDWELKVRGDGSEKLTIGGRSGERYGRIYVKDDERVRHELELKGQLARMLCAAGLTDRLLGDIWRDQYRRLVEWPAAAVLVA